MLHKIETRFVFLPSSKNARVPTLKPHAVELVFFTGAIPSARDASSDPGRWSGEAVAQFQRKQKEIQQATRDEKPEADDPRVIKVHLSSGGQSVFIGLEEGLKRYDLHTALRKSCEECLVSARGSAPATPLWIDLRHLGDELARSIAQDLAFLSVSGGWKPRRFGKKASKASASPVQSVGFMSMARGLPG